MTFNTNPLSLSIPQHTLDAWVHEQAPHVDARSRRNGPVARSLAYFTVDDLMQNPKPWREFFAVDRLREAYSFPERWRDAPSRVTANIYTYIGNYLRLALVLMLCVLLNSADVDRQGLGYKISYIAASLCTSHTAQYHSHTGHGDMYRELVDAYVKQCRIDCIDWGLTHEIGGSLSSFESSH
eukprot:849751-Prorocentrum_minimum.AAC.2